MSRDPHSFDLDSITNERVRSVLQAAGDLAGAYIQPTHVVLGAIQGGDDRVRGVLALALRPGNSLEDLLWSGSATLDPSSQTAGPYRKLLALDTQRALESFAAAYLSPEGVPEDIALELLLHFVLVNLDHQE